jgi:hypothetical protein
MANEASLQEAFKVELPAGGELVLMTQEEVDVWERTKTSYVLDYRLTKTNDLVLLGAILSQNLTLFRAQQTLNGMKPQLDAAGVPTGLYEAIEVTAKTTAAAQKAITTASEEIRALEKALGIDKKTREAGGAYNVADYIATLKQAAKSMGIHISERFLFYENVMMEARWQIRLLRNGDPEDKLHHNVSEANVIKWLEDRLAEAEEIDREYAANEGKLYLGKL